MRTKRLVRTVHLALAVAAGAPLLVLGVTGALLVFPEPLGRAVHGDRAAGPGLRPASELVAAAAAPLPAGDRVVRMQYPVEPGDVLVAQTKQERTVVLDPSTAAVLRVVKADGFDVRHFLVRLHVNLFAGEAGGWVTGSAAVALGLLVVTGLFLWWPRGRWARHYFAVKLAAGRPRLNYDLHRAGGLYAAPPLLLIAATGAAMTFYGPVSGAVNWLTGSPPRPPAPTKVVLPASPRPILSADEVVAAASARVPGAGLYRLYPPKADDAPYRVFLVPDHDRRTRFEETRLVIDPYTAAVLHEEGPRTMSDADRVMRWLLPLHFGTPGGTPMRVAYLFASLTPVMLAATGFLIWRKRSRGRSAAARIGAARSRTESGRPPHEV